MKDGCYMLGSLMGGMTCNTLGMEAKGSLRAGEVVPMRSTGQRRGSESD